MPMFEWNMVTRLVTKMTWVYMMRLDYIVLKTRDNILSSVVNTNGRAYVIS